MENTHQTGDHSETHHVSHIKENNQASFIIGVVAICFAAIGAAWSFIGGACCGWAGCGFAFIGFVLAIVSLTMKRSKLGWWELGLSIFAFIWVFVSAAIAGHAVSQSLNNYNNYYNNNQ